jgi:fucokinase
MTTGGGWQDQVGAIYPGFKIGRSSPALPLRVRVEPVEASVGFCAAFERRTWVVYTGQQRLAKNTLINALRRCALTPAVAAAAAPSGHGGHNSTVAALVRGAEDGAALIAKVFERTSFSLIADDDDDDEDDEDNGDDDNKGDGDESKGSHTQEGTVASTDAGDDLLDSIGSVLSTYWELKKEMAAGSEPPHIHALLAHLRPLAAGLSLCGAGAGGFAVVILRRDKSRADLDAALRALPATLQRDASGLSVHTVKIDHDGVSTHAFPCGPASSELVEEYLFKQQ